MTEFSYFDRIKKEKSKIELELFLTNAGLSISGTILLISILPLHEPFHSFVAFCLASIFLFISSHKLREKFAGTYAQKLSRIEYIRQAIKEMRQKVNEIYRKYPDRRKGEQFKKAFSLQGKNRADLEEALAVAMFKEQKEVFVTAFMKDDKAVRVTATIGSTGSCRNSDDVHKWSYYLDKLRCDEIRQYHNHPVTNNSTNPSSINFYTCKRICDILGDKANLLKSYVIYWNEIKEWRVMRYGTTRVEKVEAFCVAANCGIDQLN